MPSATNSLPVVFTSIAECADFIFSNLGSDIRLATPLGLGKPNHLLNALYNKAVSDSTKSLTIHTALSLNPPIPKNELARRFFGPFGERQWGKKYPRLEYFYAAANNKLPANIHIHEFYFQAGSALNSLHLQRNYQSVNYTHVAENLFRDDINLIVQLIAKKQSPQGPRYSLSCNPDVTLDVTDLYRHHGKNLWVIGVVHPDLPFLGGEAEVPASFFTSIADSAEVNYELFALPRMPISVEDHLIGLFASLYVVDGGTLQIGIGSLSDAIVAALKVRHRNSEIYQAFFEKFSSRLRQQAPVGRFYTDVFRQGLYGLTEMVTDGFMHLRQAQILKRFVTDEDTGLKTYLHGSFILGSKLLYNWLRNLSAEDESGLRMSRVSKVNDLYDPKETLLRQQRVHGRFFNTTMQMSLLGEAASETLPDAKVVSGVGGQFNFVSMALELKGARSVLMLRSVRIGKSGRRISNVVWNASHITVPRHCRDIVITEYGVAELRGRSDEDCIKAMLNITDSDFQQDLLKTAQQNNKIAKDYRIPAEFQNNTPEQFAAPLKVSNFKSLFRPFPFGSDFTPEEEKIVIALQALQYDQRSSRLKLLGNVVKGLPKNIQNFAPELGRMGLLQPQNLAEYLYRRLLLQYLDAGAKMD
jgi:acyl-CoA hydrolase